ncbi:related to P.falciparum dihydropteroate synthase [Ramularia collo-cygni]|uniref:Related to P.falciparum dihydropteroate synthase n=1 Tax=Ramularia collo-cygni TaxID=112498 RepID=A0A2D3VAU1_9PEZI|nr:related to P.falciparum dihydropteroate synthase [Ramularia collo-cygni]CZT18669.1 related to P.falciparum dihydropteroate synthase [Ramularia collo-cygni]
MEAGGKRKAQDSAGRDEKRPKTKKSWLVPRNGNTGKHQVRDIQYGDSGIWVTCNKNKESACVGEMRDLFTEFAERLYPQAMGSTDADEDDDDDTEIDIEKEIQAEVDAIRKPTSAPLFTHVRVNLQCVVFFKTIAPIEPVAFVKAICEDAMQNPQLKRTRFSKRLTPMTLIGRASEEGLEKVALEVLKPHFHKEPFEKRKFAIRPTLRNHNILSRDSIIKQVASLVGPGHEVDLKNYELLIMVEVYQHVCGVSVVDSDFERLKRYNISEIFDPTPKAEIASKKEDAGAKE